MSKAALNMAAKSLSVDWKKDGIAVAMMNPGFVKTGKKILLILYRFYLFIECLITCFNIN